MLADVKHRKSPFFNFEQWKDVPEAQIYWLAALMKIGGKFYLKMQWEGTDPQRGIEHILHYAGCNGCQHTVQTKGGYAAFLFCNSRFVYGVDFKHSTLLPHEKEYSDFIRSLINGL